MPAPVPAPTAKVSLLEIIDFKWLMAGHGHGVHVERMQNDPAYARECLLCGATSCAPTLRASAQRLAGAMGIALAAGTPGAPGG